MPDGPIFARKVMPSSTPETLLPDSEDTCCGSEEFAHGATAQTLAVPRTAKATTQADVNVARVNIILFTGVAPYRTRLS